jgi:hypothetical protein
VPYIPIDRRNDLTEFAAEPATPGELNYMITQAVLDYQGCHGLSYQTINDILGALEGAKLEYYRRIALPYEDKKRIENGEVYEI